MNTLYIDTHDNIHIVLLSDTKIIKENKVLDKKENSTILMNAIIDTIDNNELDEIIVVNGPGSFTGVRLGVTIAKTLAYTKQISIKTITYLELMALHIESEKKIVAFNDRNGYFVGYFNSDNSLYKDYEYIKNSDFEEKFKETNVIKNVEIDFKKIIEYMKDKESKNPHLVNPIYVKKIEVEL